MARQTDMVRRGWHEWSKQWVQVFRGPRPQESIFLRVLAGTRRRIVLEESDMAARETIQASLVKARAAASPVSENHRMSSKRRNAESQRQRRPWRQQFRGKNRWRRRWWKVKPDSVASNKSWRCRLSRFQRRQKCSGYGQW